MCYMYMEHYYHYLLITTNTCTESLAPNQLILHTWNKYIKLLSLYYNVLHVYGTLLSLFINNNKYMY